jgi:hypothetical protein
MNGLSTSDKYLKPETLKQTPMSGICEVNDGAGTSPVNW